MVIKLFVSSDPTTLVNGIKLATKNIEYHPKIISANSRPFINFIEKLCEIKSKQGDQLHGKAREVLVNFLERFPATMKEIANEMESRENNELSLLIKERNQSLNYEKKCNSVKKKVKPSFKEALEVEEAKLFAKEKNDKAKSHVARMLEISPTRKSSKHKDSLDFGKAGEGVIGIRLKDITTPTETSNLSSLESLIVITGDDTAFDIFPLAIIRQLISERSTLKDRHTALDHISKALQSQNQLRGKFLTSVRFSKFILAILDPIDDSYIPKLLEILKQLVDSGLISENDNLKNIFDSIVKHLGSTVIDIRQEAMRTFISIMKNMDNNFFISTSLQFLTSNNWRIREEILNLIIINLLNKIEVDFDYKSMITHLAKLVNDDNAKVRFVAREALAILANKGDKSKVMEL